MQLTTAPAYAPGLAITKSDTTQVNCRAIWVGGTGDVAISRDGVTAAVTYSAVPAGTILPIALDGGRVMSTNTTATLMVALD